MSDKLATKADLQEMYSRILPYLNRQEALANASMLAKIGENIDGKPTYDGELLSVPNNGCFDRKNIYTAVGTEQVIGRWTNGKPIYQKIIDCGTLTTSNVDTNKLVAIGALIDEVIDFKAIGRWIVANTNDGFFDLKEWIGSKAFDNYVRVYIRPNTSYDVDKNKIQINYCGDFSWLKRIYVTIQYTKTGDTANSFNYAGENDYSTTEKIVGTWVDGKPIYQKTINFGALPNATSKSVAHNISNMKDAVSLKTIIYNSSGPNWFELIDVNSTGKVRRAIVDRTYVYITTQQDDSVMSAYMTVQYTKTTD